MYGLILSLHVIFCILLVTIILMQSGRGGGLTGGFAAAESMFGAKTNVMLVRATTVLSILFFTTCLSLAFLSTQASRSLMSDIDATHEPAAGGIPVTELPTPGVVPQGDAGISAPPAQPAPEPTAP